MAGAISIKRDIEHFRQKCEAVLAKDNAEKQIFRAIPTFQLKLKPLYSVAFQPVANHQEKQPMPEVGGKTIEVLFSPQEIAARNLELAKAIAERGFHDLLTISILKGSFIFAADLIRAMHDVGVEPDVEFITVSSYGKGTESGETRLLRDIDSDVRDRDVLLIDDILESGKTLKFVRELMLERGARSVSIAVLLDKSVRRKVDLEADFVAFECPDYFVVGYGMDVAHSFRQLPYVGHVKD